MSQTPNTAIAVIGIDIGKDSFHVVRQVRTAPSCCGKSRRVAKWKRGSPINRLALSARKPASAPITSAANSHRFGAPANGVDRILLSSEGRCRLVKARRPARCRRRSQDRFCIQNARSDDGLAKKFYGLSN